MKNNNSCGRNSDGTCFNGIAPALENPDDFIYNKVIATVPLWYHTMVCVILTSLAINGMLLNGLVLRHFWNRRKNLQPYNLLLVNLTCAELILASIGIPFDVLALLQNGWRFGKDICIVVGTLVTTSGFVSILSICTLAIFGYGSIFRFGSRQRKARSLSTVVIILLSIWFYSLALSLPPLFGWGRYVPELSGLGCAPDWHSEKSSKGYIVWILIFGFTIPTIIIVISILLTITQAKELRISSLSNSRDITNHTSNRINFRLIIAMTLAFLSCWLPYAFLSFIHSFISKSVIGPMLSMVPTMTVKLSVCANPILYIAYNPHLKMLYQTPGTSSEIQQNYDHVRKISIVGNDKDRSNFQLQSLRSILEEIKDQENKEAEATENHVKNDMKILPDNIPNDKHPHMILKYNVNGYKN